MKDHLFLQFVAAYPPSRQQRGYMAETLFLAALEKTSFQVLMDSVEQHKRSVQWQGGIIPNLITWLQQERWNQILPEPERVPDRRLTPFEQARRAGLK
jgi:hypothetical protein